MTNCYLKDVAEVIISNVDKKITEGQSIVKLCNYTDVYYNWAITKRNEQVFMTASATQSEIEKYGIFKGCVAITKDSETKDDIGKATYIADNFDSDVLLGYHCALIIPDETKISGKYLNALLHTDFATRYFELNATGSGQRFTLSIDALMNFQLHLPDIETQNNIARLFTVIDKKIENNNAINDNLAA